MVKTMTTTEATEKSIEPSVKEVRAIIATATMAGKGSDPRVLKMKEWVKAKGLQPVTRRCRATGTKITVCTAEDAGAGDDGSSEGLPWFTVCETHGTCVGHKTRREAESWAASPNWCTKCQKVLSGRSPIHLTGDGSDDDLSPDQEST